MQSKFNDGWISSADKNELRDAIDEVYAEMSKYEMFSSEYNKLSDLHNRLVTAWSSNPDGELPKHQHGWYLPEDDD